MRESSSSNSTTGRTHKHLLTQTLQWSHISNTPKTNSLHEAIKLELCRNIRSVTVHVFLPNFTVRTSRFGASKYSPVTVDPHSNPEGGVHGNATLFDNCHRKKSKRRTAYMQMTWALEKKSPLDSVYESNASFSKRSGTWEIKYRSFGLRFWIFKYSLSGGNCNTPNALLKFYFSIFYVFCTCIITWNAFQFCIWLWPNTILRYRRLYCTN